MQNTQDSRFTSDIKKKNSKLHLKQILVLFVTKAQSKETSMMKHSVNWWILCLKVIMVSWQ